MQDPNYYEILGVSTGASREDVVRAYRRLALRFHPDVQPPERRPWAEEQMKRINEAYAVLGDPEERARYNTTFVRSLDASYVRPRPHSRQRKRAVSMIFWLLAVGSLALGVYAYTFDWDTMFHGSLTALEELGLRVLFAQVWWAAFAVILFKVIPLRR
jgi:curved DNA-binding protein CbpA